VIPADSILVGDGVHRRAGAASFTVASCGERTASAAGTTRKLDRLNERVQAIAKVVHLGGKIATAEGSIVDGAGKLYAHATSTCLLM